MSSPSSCPLKALLSAEAVRARCNKIGEIAERGQTKWFRYHPENLERCVSIVTAECQGNYPDQNIPLHSRWRHFEIGGIDLWKYYAKKKLHDLDEDAKTRTAIDLVFLSVLLDAGAGAQWRYNDPVSQTVLSRSEGLAAASVDLFFNYLGRDTGCSGVVLNADAISSISDQVLESAFQHRVDNELLGIEGRKVLLERLAAQLDVLAKHGVNRPGDVVDLVDARRGGREVSAGRILELVLECFNPMWPSGVVKEGIFLGDCGHHSHFKDSDAGGLVPFHKLSQWLSYSLIEPLQWSGFKVLDLDQLTGLPEYRNGGLFLDTEVLVATKKDLYNKKLEVHSEPVVEWRALTVWLLDRVAAGVRRKLSLSAEQLPLASVLQGGTWSAGRKLAEQRRGGVPPLDLAIDGTVF